VNLVPRDLLGSSSELPLGFALRANNSPKCIHDFGPFRLMSNSLDCGRFEGGEAGEFSGFRFRRIPAVYRAALVWRGFCVARLLYQPRRSGIAPPWGGLSALRWNSAVA